MSPKPPVRLTVAVLPDSRGGALENEHRIPFAVICCDGVQVNTALPSKPEWPCESVSTVKLADAPAVKVALVGLPPPPGLIVPATLYGIFRTWLTAPS